MATKMITEEIVEPTIADFTAVYVRPTEDGTGVILTLSYILKRVSDGSVYATRSVDLPPGSLDPDDQAILDGAAAALVALVKQVEGF